jgi:hypothetical protein
MSLIEIHFLPIGVFENHSFSFLGGVLPIVILNSSPNFPTRHPSGSSSPIWYLPNHSLKIVCAVV